MDVFGDPDYAWLATVSGEGPALIGSTKQDAIASVVREWGDARSNAIDLLDAWQGPGPRPSTLWIQPLLERVLGKRLAAELLLAHGTGFNRKAQRGELVNLVNYVEFDGHMALLDETGGKPLTGYGPGANTGSPVATAEESAR